MRADHWLATRCLGLVAACWASGCVEEQRYAVERARVELTEDAEPAFFDEDDEPIFVVEDRFGIPITPPKEANLADLGMLAEGMNLPFPRLPWVEREDLEIQVDYALENRGESPLSVMLFLDGINEFFAYAPVEEDFHQWERRFELEPGERVSGTITELEMDEVAIDLATVVNGAPNSAQVVQFQSQSGRDPRVQPYIPSVVPGLVAFNMGMQTDVATDLRLIVSARVQDHDDRIAERGDPSWDPPTPVDFAPVVPEEE